MSETTPRLRALNDSEPQRDGRYVLYWMVAARRTRFNFALERALHWARKANKPLIVFEALRVDYPWASARHHAFVIEGMADQRARFADTPIRYLPYIEPAAEAGRGLLEALAAEAVAVVTDDWPGFFVGRMVERVGARLSVRCEAIDGNGLLPLDVAGKLFGRAYDLRRFLQRELRPWLERLPLADPLAELDLPEDACAPVELPGAVAQREDLDVTAWLDAPRAAVAQLPIDQEVGPVDARGGERRAAELLDVFLGERLALYAEGRRDVTEATTSGLSPWLHYGHISAHEVFARLIDREGWTPDRVSSSRSGAREGWWGMSPAAESFLDELITWRELGLHRGRHQADPDRWESLPDWARASLEEHAGDEREALYTLEQFENASTHDEVWNAAQRQLRGEGVIHNYLRMYWGKMILAWSASPQEALAIMLELNNRWATDGRDPNSTSGITWVLGRYDRAWGPERPVFGKVRYMSPQNTRRKLQLKTYLERWSAQPGLFETS